MSDTSAPNPLRQKEKRDPEATREALLRAGAEMFAAAGYEGVRVEALARRAGVNKAMINYHFGGKRRLYVAVIRSAFAELGARVEGLRRSERPPAELLAEFIASFAELATQRRPGVPALVIREALAPGELSRELVPAMANVYRGVREILERGIRDGSFRAVDPILAHMNLIGSLVFFFATEPMRRRVLAQLESPIEPPSAEAYVQYTQQLVARGLAPAPADQGVES